jgi:hypothetical protein
MISREDVIDRSLMNFIRDQLTGLGYFEVPPGADGPRVQILDSYPSDDRMTKPLDRNYIAVGYSQDDGGRPAEMGTQLTRRLHTFDFHTFGISRIWGRNLAQIIKAAIEVQETIPLVVTQGDNQSYVTVEYAMSQEAPVQSPRPWQINLWLTRIRVEDYYNPTSIDG